jgi:hypothetical protein
MALQSSLEGSGLFYESHLLEWMRGRWPIERLRNEPQFHLPAPRRSEIAAPEESPRLNDERLDMPAEADRKASAAGGDSIVAYDALQHLKLQLHVVDHRQVTWQGQLWPAQSAEWKVDEPPEQRAAEESPEWSSRLHLTMPRLGGITAQLVLTDRSLRMQVQVETTATREALTGAGDDLLQRLRDAGIELRAFQVLDATG